MWLVLALCAVFVLAGLRGDPSPLTWVLIGVAAALVITGYSVLYYY